MKETQTRSRPPGPVILDIAATTLSEEDKDILLHPQVGGVIFFSRNITDIDQIHDLLAEIRMLRPELLLTVDQEGGRVQRLREGITLLPAQGQIGSLYKQQPADGQSLANLCGLILAAEMLALGFDLSWAPVLDLDRGLNEVIGDRAFAADVSIVTVLGQAILAGMEAGGMAATGKHFPGHGGVTADSHVAIPEDSRALDTLWMEDIAPFQTLCPQLAAIMPAHVKYLKVDEQPAGFSSIWLQDILRQKIGFEGVIVSDDLSMEGATTAGGYPERAQAALEAGCDMLLVCNDRQGAIEVLEFLEKQEKLIVWKPEAWQQRIQRLHGKREQDWHTYQESSEKKNWLRLLRRLWPENYQSEL